MVVPPWRHPSYVVDAIKALSTLVGVEELALYLMIEEDDIATIEATTPKKPIQYNLKELREKYVGAVDHGSILYNVCVTRGVVRFIVFKLSLGQRRLHSCHSSSSAKEVS